MTMLLVGERLVLAEGPVRADAAASVVHEEVAVCRERVEVDGESCGC
jgi:hypothetical protein